jgi:hypothetical protein
MNKQLAIMIMLMAASAGPLCSQEQPRTYTNWESFSRTVKPGKRIAVTILDSTRVTGRLLAADPQTLRIEGSAGVTVIEAARILRIRDAGLRKRNILYGMLAGFVGGAGAVIPQG